jgi:homoserine kinase
MNRESTVWAPATIANLNVGFDSLGCALTNPGEKMIVRMTDVAGDVRIKSIHGAELDFNADRNIAAVAAKSLLQALDNPCGVELELFKDIKPGSGIGSSAASAAGAVVGVNELLKAGLGQDELLTFALDGEQIASGARHADNVAPALLGGLVLCPPQGKPIALPVPNDWHLVVLHPQIEVKTADSRGALPLSVSLEAAAKQSSWMGTFVAACYRDDSEQAALALEDLLIAPHRQKLIPHFQHIKQIALKSGALAGGISGSGPSTFWVAKSEEDALAVARSLEDLMILNSVPFQLHQAQIAQKGAHIIG